MKGDNIFLRRVLYTSRLVSRGHMSLDNLWRQRLAAKPITGPHVNARTSPAVQFCVHWDRRDLSAGIYRIYTTGDAFYVINYCLPRARFRDISRYVWTIEPI